MFYQIQHFGASEYFRKENGINFNFASHLHKSFELITVTEGEMKIEVDGTMYTIHPSDGILVFPNQMHSLTATCCKHILFIFSPDLVKAYSNKYINMLPQKNKFNLGKYNLEQLMSLSEDAPVYAKKAAFYSVCSEFDSQVEYIGRNDDDNDLFYKIFDFVENHYADECSLAALSKKISYNYSYLSKYFKDIVKVSYNEYVNMHRINNACYLLSNTNYPILQCAFECGYKSLRSFNRNFKQIIGITPREYKIKYQNNHI